LDYNLIKFYNWKSRIKSTNKTVAWDQVIDASFISICK
jgi:hypothetical protein